MAEVGEVPGGVGGARRSKEGQEVQGGAGGQRGDVSRLGTSKNRTDAYHRVDGSDERSANVPAALPRMFSAPSAAADLQGAGLEVRVTGTKQHG